MKAVVFLVYLCSLLLGGQNHAYAGTVNNSTNHTAYTVEKKQQVKFSYTNREHKATNYSGSDKEERFLINDVEDEEVENVIARKCKLIIGHSYICCYQSILLYLYNSFKAPPHFCHLASHKYITQRVLRI